MLEVFYETHYNIIEVILKVKQIFSLHPPNYIQIKEFSVAKNCFYIVIRNVLHAFNYFNKNIL